MRLFNTKQIRPGSFTGSLQGTASWASNALTASYFSGSITNAQTASYVVSASYAATASYVENAITNRIATGSITASVNNDNVIFSLVSESISLLEIDQYGSLNHGNANITIGTASHAEGQATIAIGDYSHAEGLGTQSPGTGSHTEGLGTITYGDYQHAEGHYNRRFNTSSILIIGNGTDDSNRSDLALFNSESIIFSSSLEVTNGITGSLQGTASYALFALALSGSTNSSSYAQTASYVILAQSASYVLNAQSSSYSLNTISSSYSAFASASATASYVENAQTASYVENAQTASYVENAQTASYVLNAQSASYALNIKGGLQNYIPLWATNNVLTSSLIYQSGSSICISSSNGLKFGVTQNDFVNGFASNLPASVQINHGGSDYGLAITRYTNDASSANFTFYRTRGGSASVKGALSDGTRIGAINILGVAADGTTTSVGGGFTWYGIPTNTGEAYGTGTPASSSMPILLDYRTVGFANTSEYIRMRLYPNGEFVFADSTGTVGLVKGVKMQIRGKALIENSLKIGAFEEASAGFILDVTGSSKFIGDVQITGSLYAPSITGSLQGTASYVLSSSYALTSSLPLLGVTTASVSNTTITFTKGDGTTFDITVSQSGSVSTASYALFAENAATASYVLNAVSASYSTTASYALNSNFNSSQITLGSVTASVNTDTSSFSLTSGSVILFKINNSGSVAFGDFNFNKGIFSLSHGYNTQASGAYSHAEGNGNVAEGIYSHAEGYSNQALGHSSHAEGWFTNAEGAGSLSAGYWTYAHENYSVAFGKLNRKNNSSSLFVIGNGVSDSNRSDLALFNSESIVFNKPVTGSIFTGSFIGDLQGTSSYATVALNANTASYVLNAISSSYSTTASYYGGDVISSSYALSSSQTENANTASYVLNAISSSYSNTASYADTASYVLNPTIHSYIATGSVSASLSDNNNIFRVISGSRNILTVSSSGNVIIGNIPSTIYALDVSGSAISGSGRFQNGLTITGSFNVRNVSGDTIVFQRVNDAVANIPTIHAAAGALRIGSGSASSLYLYGRDIYLGNLGGFIYISGSVISGNNFSSYLGAPSTYFKSTYTGELFVKANTATSGTLYSNTSSLSSAGTSVIYQIGTASYVAGFFDYTVYSGSNARAGTVQSVWNGSSVQYTDTSTADIGSTTDIVFSVDISSSFVRFLSTSTLQWNVRTTYKLL